MKLVAVSILVAVALLAAPAVQAQPQTTVVKIHEVGFGDAMPGCLVVFAFPLVSPSGEPLGSGTACLTGGDFACFPGFAGCKQSASSIFTFNLPGGTVVASMSLREVFTSESTLVQVGSGEIAGGGRIVGGGTLAFTDTGADADLTYVVQVR